MLISEEEKGTEWMDVGSVGLIGFAVALPSARPSVAVRWAKRNKRPDKLHVRCYMGNCDHDHPERP